MLEGGCQHDIYVECWRGGVYMILTLSVGGGCLHDINVECWRGGVYMMFTLSVGGGLCT